MEAVAREWLIRLSDGRSFKWVSKAEVDPPTTSNEVLSTRGRREVAASSSFKRPRSCGKADEGRRAALARRGLSECARAPLERELSLEVRVVAVGEGHRTLALEHRNKRVHDL
jgi:hypothetical protein